MRDRTRGIKLGQRLQDDIHQLEIDHLIIGNRRGRLGIGDATRRKHQPHHFAHAIVEAEVGPEAPDQSIEHAGFHHRGTQVDRAACLRIAGGEIEMRKAIPDRDGHREPDRLIEDDTVAVEKTFR